MVKSKKAVSAMIGYILLVSFGIVMSVIVFNYLQTYVPKDLGGCPSGTSLFLKDYSYDASGGNLTIIVKNNGKFNIAGFFILGTNNTEAEIATIDLSKNVKQGEESAAGECLGTINYPSCETLGDSECYTDAYCDWNGTDCETRQCSEVPKDSCDGYGCTWEGVQSSARLYGNAIVTSVGQENLIRPNEENIYTFENLGTYGTLRIIEITPMRFQEENSRIRPITCGESKVKEILS